MATIDLTTAASTGVVTYDASGTPKTDGKASDVKADIDKKTLTATALSTDIKSADGWTISVGSVTSNVSVTAAANNTITTGSGDDSIAGTGNNIKLSLGKGDNQVVLTSSNETSVTTDNGDDSINVTGNNATISAGAGDNIITVTGTSATITTDRGDDQISVTGAYANINAGAGDDSIYVSLDGTEHDATVNAGAGDDLVVVNGHGANVDAGAGSDSISIVGTYATVDAGTGNDSIYITNSNQATVDAGEGHNFVSIAGKNNTVTAGSGNDIISIDGDGNNYVDAGDGRNTISLNGDNNTVKSGAGNDTITVDGAYANITIGDGNDSVSVSGKYATVTGGAGNDTINVAANASVTESSGNNLIKAGTSDANVTVTAGAGNDTVDAQGQYNYIALGDGNNSVHAGEYATVTAGTGNDTIQTSINSSINAGAGADSILTANDVTITAGAGKDTISVASTGVVLTDYEFDVDRIVMTNASVPGSLDFGTDGKVSTSVANITVSEQSGGYYAVQLTQPGTTKHMNYAWTGTDAATINGTTAKEAVYEIGTKNDSEGDLLWGSKYNDTVIAGSNDSVVGDKGNDSISIASGATGVYVGFNTGDGNDSVFGAKNTLGYDDDDTTIYLNSIDKLGATVDGTTVKVTVKGASLTLSDAETVSNDAKVKLQYAGTTYNTQIFSSSTTLDDETALVYGNSKTTDTLSITGAEDYTIDLGNEKRYNDTRLYNSVEVVDATGSTGDNILIGGEKSSTLKAGTGATTLWGGSSKADLLVGGTGEDIFVYGNSNNDGRDTISGYDSDNDKVFFVNSDKFKSVKRTSDGVTFAFTSDTASAQKLTIGATATSTSLAADAKYVWTTDGTNVETAKIGYTDSVNSFTYDEEVKYYAGGKKGDTLKVTGSDDANVWLDNSGQGGAYYNGITTVDASTTNGDVTLAGSAANEKLYASLGDSSLFGGAGNDLLVANANGGTTTFFFGKGCGKDTISGSDADDRIMLYDVALSDINGDKSSVGSDLKIALNDGSALTVSSVAAGTTFTLGDGTSWTYENGSFEQA